MPDSFEIVFRKKKEDETNVEYEWRKNIFLIEKERKISKPPRNEEEYDKHMNSINTYVTSRETVIKSNMEKGIIFSTIGLSLLLFASLFPLIYTPADGNSVLSFVFTLVFVVGFVLLVCGIFLASYTNSIKHSIVEKEKKTYYKNILIVGITTIILFILLLIYRFTVEKNNLQNVTLQNVTLQNVTLQNVTLASQGILGVGCILYAVIEPNLFF